jgi:hypothetical protein
MEPERVPGKPLLDRDVVFFAAIVSLLTKGMTPAGFRLIADQTRQKHRAFFCRMFLRLAAHGLKNSIDFRLIGPLVRQDDEISWRQEVSGTLSHPSLSAVRREILAGEEENACAALDQAIWQACGEPGRETISAERLHLKFSRWRPFRSLPA